MKDRIPFARRVFGSAIAVLLLGLSLGLLLFLPVANAQDAQSGEADPWAGVEEMLVTGSGTASLLGDIAQANSVTAFDEETLQAIGAGDISDLAAFTPNLEIVTAGSTAPTFFIRGIGLNDFNSNAAGAVAI
jgi:iron complex outermembrane receptor protein